MKKKLCCLFFCFTWCMLHAQDKSNKGTEFWLGYGNNVLFDHDFPVNNQTLVLYLSAEATTTVTVSVNGTSWSKTITIPANTVDFSITLPKDGADDCRIISEGIFDRAIHVVSDKPIVAYAHQYDAQLSGATMLLPVETYGYSYYSINYQQPLVPGTPGKNWFFVIASEDNTTIQVTPSDTTETGKLPGQPFTVNLQKGQLYNVFGKVTDEVCKDITGSKILSITGADGNCHPIAVFSGSSRFIVCASDGGEVAQQQIFPASAWGTRYLSFHSLNVTTNPLTTPFLNFYRVMVADPTTVVKRNGVVLTGLQKNTFYEYQSTSGDYVEADKPIMLCQYTPNSNQCTGNSLSPQGDPELIFLSPIEQNIKKATIYNTRNNNITINYLTVIIPNAGINSLRIDGAAVPASMRIIHPNNPDYTVVARRLLGPAAQHTVQSDSAFSAMLYGTGLWESYGYIAGTLINNLNSIGSINNVYNSIGTTNEFTCPNSPFQLSIKLAYRASSIQWLGSQVAGLSPAKDSTINNPLPIDSQYVNGRKYFTYVYNSNFTFSDTGVYYIPVVYTSPEIDHCSQLEKTTVTVNVKPGPVANFNYIYHGCTIDTAVFTGLPDLNNFTISKYAWNWEDNTSDTANTISRKFSEGVHPVKLTVISTNGCLSDSTKLISTFPKPVAKFGYNRNICAGDSTLFRDSSTITEGNIAQWNWNFADGNTTTLLNNTPFYHLYLLADTFNVSLAVVSREGCTSDTTIVPVPVNNRPSVSIGFSGKPCIDSSIVVTPVVTANGNTIQSGLWNFGDGNTQTVTNTNTITHAYTIDRINIPVTFIISGGPGCESDTARQTVPAIYPNPEAKFTATASAFCLQKNILFTYTGSSVNLQGWSWVFDNGFSTDASPVRHKYATAGAHAVTLKVTNAQGCGSAPFTDSVTIYPPPNIDAGPAILKTAVQPIQIAAVMNDSGSYQYQWSASFVPGYNQCIEAGYKCHLRYDLHHQSHRRSGQLRGDRYRKREGVEGTVYSVCILT